MQIAFQCLRKSSTQNTAWREEHTEHKEHKEHKELKERKEAVASAPKSMQC